MLTDQRETTFGSSYQEVRVVGVQDIRDSTIY